MFESSVQEAGKNMPAAETSFVGSDVAAVASLLESVLVLGVAVAVGVSCLCCPAVDSGMVGLGAGFNKLLASSFHLWSLCIQHILPVRAEAAVHLDYTPQALHHIH